MILFFNAYNPKSGDVENCMTVEITGEPNSVTLEFSGENGALSEFKKNLLKKADAPGKDYYSELEIRVPDSGGRFDARKMSHWKEAERIWHGAYLNANIIEE